MNFWGVEVKCGDQYVVRPTEGTYVKLFQANLGKIKNGSKDYIYLYLHVGENKYVLGALHPERVLQQMFDLSLHKSFQLSHTSKDSVYFYGCEAVQNAMSQVSGVEKDNEDEGDEEETPKKVSGKKSPDESTSNTPSKKVVTS